jgi:hypothetical protein
MVLASRLGPSILSPNQRLEASSPFAPKKINNFVQLPPPPTKATFLATFCKIRRPITPNVQAITRPRAAE